MNLSTPKIIRSVRALFLCALSLVWISSTSASTTLDVGHISSADLVSSDTTGPYIVHRGASSGMNLPSTAFTAVGSEDELPGFAGESESRSTGLRMLVDNQSFTSGEQIEVVFTSDNFEDINSFQYTTAFDHTLLQYDSVRSISLGEGELSLSVVDTLDGVISTVWLPVGPVSYDPTDELFVLYFTALADGELLGALDINSEFTESRSFQNFVPFGEVELFFDGMSSVEDASPSIGFYLLQNEPNPFDQQTIIRYVLSESSEVAFSVFDASGRLVLTSMIDGRAGRNQLRVLASDVPGSGVYYYQLATARHAAARKMVVGR